MTARSPSQRGYTLLELLVSAGIIAVVSVGALALMSSQQRAFRVSAGDRALQETARTALSELGTNLRRAGYGIEPWLAFDFGPVTNPPPSWIGATPGTTQSYPSGIPGSIPPPCNPTVTVASRDRIDLDTAAGTASDEIVFYARDPAFNRPLASAPTGSGGSFTLTFAPPNPDDPTSNALKSPLYPGQVLQVMCGAASAWAYVTVGAVADVGATTVTLSAACTGGFPYEQSMLAASCFNLGWSTARVFKVDRFHYYVQRFADAATGAQRPYLMLDRGLWNGTTPLVEPVAPDVEDVQFAYVYPRSATQTLVGAASGAQLAQSTSGIDLTVAPPAYTDTSTAVSRTTNHPANLRGVRVSVTVRSPTPDLNLRPVDSSTVPAAANRPALTGTKADATYRRILVETTESIRNLEARGPYYPAYSTNGGADGLNVGGG